MQCNTIFCFTAMTLTSVGETDDAKGKTISEIGSMLFTRGVSGTRVVTGRDTKVIEGYTFKGKFTCLYTDDEHLQLGPQLTIYKNP